jgi:hypothetical protein
MPREIDKVSVAVGGAKGPRTAKEDNMIYQKVDELGVKLTQISGVLTSARVLARSPDGRLCSVRSGMNGSRLRAKSASSCTAGSD